MYPRNGVEKRKYWSILVLSKMHFINKICFNNIYFKEAIPCYETGIPDNDKGHDMNRKRHKKGLRFGRLLLVLLLFSTIVACGKVKESHKDGNNNLQSDSRLQVHYIDVGQGDATLISCDGHSMLIDAGNNDKGELVCDYLRQQKISALDYIIGTHPDADHVGGLDIVIKKYDCTNVFLSADQKDTVTYRDVLSAIDEKGYKAIHPTVGSAYALGSAEFTIVGPSKKAEDANDNSIALILHHGKNSFYFEGDAQEEEENSILSSSVSIAANVYKIGHHGSSTSTSDQMLDSVRPAFAVISVGENNYGHPNAEVLNKLRAKGVQLFRTDEQGTIVATSDGTKISWNCSTTESWQAGEAVSSSVPNTKQDAETNAQTDVATDANTGDTTVYITKTGAKYHMAGCEYLKGSGTQIRLSDAKAQGYEPCAACHPSK